MTSSRNYRRGWIHATVFYLFLNILIAAVLSDGLLRFQ